MLTNNFKAILNGLFVYSKNSKVSVVGKNGNKSVLTGGTSGYLSIIADADVYLSDVNYNGIYLGSGESPVTRGDYKIDLVKVGKVTSAVSFGLDDDGKPYTLFSIAYSNNSSQNVKISEIGYFLTVSTVDNIGSVLIDRTLLDSPVVVAPGESCGIKYKITNLFDV